MTFFSTPEEAARRYYAETGNRRAAMIRARNVAACAMTAGAERFARQVYQATEALPPD